MMLLKNSIYFLCLSFVLCTGCNLDRDNPLDAKKIHSGNGVNFSRYVLGSNNNSDQQINPGESIQLKVYLKNNSFSKINKVRGTVTCSSSYISALSPVSAVAYLNLQSYDYIDVGEEGSTYSVNSIGFNVSSSTPNGTIITFNIAITDEANNTWTDSFTITVVATGASIGFSRYVVGSTNNNDPKINKGESVQLKVYLKNNGSSKANKVRGTITCSSSYISALSPVTAVAYLNLQSYDYIDAGAEGSTYSVNSIGFNVSSSTPNGSVIAFNIAITDEANNTWSDSFTITVVATDASIGFSRYVVGSTNNGDQQINPGEAIQLKVYLKNNGSSKANKVRGTIMCSSSYISALSPVTAVAYLNLQSYDYIDAGAEGSTYSVNSIGFNVSSSTPTGTVITFHIDITDESTNTWSDNFTATVY